MNMRSCPDRTRAPGPPEQPGFILCFFEPHLKSDAKRREWAQFRYNVTRRLAGNCQSDRGQKLSGDLPRGVNRSIAPSGNEVVPRQILAAQRETRHALRHELFRTEERYIFVVATC